MDFTNHIVAIFHFGNTEVYFTETMRNILIVDALILTFVFLVRKALQNFQLVPSGFQNAIEAAVEAFIALLDDTVGKKFRHLGNWYFTVIVFILFCDLVPLLGLRAPTADFATTFGLAFVTFCIIHFCGIVHLKGEYWKSYLHPIPVFLPVNILSQVASLLSLSFRLFGNILGGTIIMGMLYHLPWFCKAVFPVALHMYLDIFAGTLQAIIFTMLSLLFIKEKLPEEE